MFRILDLGCGAGKWPARLAHPPVDAQLIGIDRSRKACAEAAKSKSELQWRCVCARGEELPLPEASVDFVVSTVTLPYLDIPVALSEIHRVLKPGGKLDATLHPFSFVLRDLRYHPPVTPRALAYRMYVILNGLWFHLTGMVVKFPLSRRVECWQSARGIKLALRRAGLCAIDCTALQGGRLVVRASRPELPRDVIVPESDPRRYAASVSA